MSSSAVITSEEPFVQYENIQFAVQAGVARLTLNRPDKLNSFTGEMHAELRDALDRIQG